MRQHRRGRRIGVADFRSGISAARYLTSLAQVSNTAILLKSINVTNTWDFDRLLILKISKMPLDEVSPCRTRSRKITCAVVLYRSLVFGSEKATSPYNAQCERQNNQKLCKLAWYEQLRLTDLMRLIGAPSFDRGPWVIEYART